MTDNGCYAGPNARFLSAAPNARETVGGRVANALSVSLLAHVVGVITLLMIASRLSSSHDSVAALIRDVPHLVVALPGFGGGGSPDTSSLAPREIQRPGKDLVAIPSKAPPDTSALDRTTPPDSIEMPVVATSAGVQELPGVITAISDGLGTGRSGSGVGLGSGPGDGSGVGPGHYAGLGDGFLPGNGVNVPRLIREVKPGYTSDAMRARIQGTVRLQAIVAPDGSVSAARVVRSLDDRFGLDQEAVKTVKQWRFLPGTLAGRPVPVLIEIELTFTLR